MFGSSAGDISSSEKRRIHAAPIAIPASSAIIPTSPSLGHPSQKRKFLGSLMHSSSGGQLSPGRFAAWYSIRCMNGRSSTVAALTVMLSPDMTS
jgi:hypothetical protein